MKMKYNYIYIIKKIKKRERENQNRQKYKDRSAGIFTLNAQVNSCCTHTKHTQKQAQLIIVVAATKYYT